MQTGRHTTEREWSRENKTGSCGSQTGTVPDEGARKCTYWGEGSVTHHSSTSSLENNRKPMTFCCHDGDARKRRTNDPTRRATRHTNERTTERTNEYALDDALRHWDAKHAAHKGTVLTGDGHVELIKRWTAGCRRCCESKTGISSGQSFELDSEGLRRALELLGQDVRRAYLTNRVPVPPIPPAFGPTPLGTGTSLPS